jgi:hypothetical protein
MRNKEGAEYVGVQLRTYREYKGRVGRKMGLSGEAGILAAFCQMLLSNGSQLASRRAVATMRETRATG